MASQGGGLAFEAEHVFADLLRRLGDGEDGHGVFSQHFDPALKVGRVVRQMLRALRLAHVVGHSEFRGQDRRADFGRRLLQAVCVVAPPLRVGLRPVKPLRMHRRM